MDYFDFLRAICSGDLAKVKRVYRKTFPLNCKVTYACGSTHVIALPLITALTSGYYDIAQYLIARGADPDAFCRRRQKTPRDFMPLDFFSPGGPKYKDIVIDFLQKIREGKLDEVKAFLENCPGTLLNENLVIRGELYALPLATALKAHHDDIAEYLISRGADMAAYCRKNNTYVRQLQRRELSKNRKGN